MDCPVCIKPMDRLNLFSVDVDNCRFCGGLWLDGGELGQFIQKGNLPKRLLTTYCLDDSQQKIPEGKRNCPRCGGQLKIIKHRGVGVDVCEQCGGLWFDRGELMNIVKKYQDEVGKKKKKTVMPRIVQEFDDDGDEMIRIDDAGMFEYTETEKEHQEVTEEAAEDQVARELLAAGSKEAVVRALPKSVTQKKQVSFGLGTTSGGAFSKPMSSPFGTMSIGRDKGDVRRYQGRGGAGNLIFDCIVAFVKSFSDVRKL